MWAIEKSIVSTKLIRLNHGGLASAEKQAASSIEVRKELKDRLEREASQFGPQMVL